jgi:hypothetical protein
MPGSRDKSASGPPHLPIREVVCRSGGHLPIHEAWLERAADAAYR